MPFERYEGSFLHTTLSALEEKSRATLAGLSKGTLGYRFVTLLHRTLQLIPEVIKPFDAGAKPSTPAIAKLAATLAWNRDLLSKEGWTKSLSSKAYQVYYRMRKLVVKKYNAKKTHPEIVVSLQNKRAEIIKECESIPDKEKADVYFEKFLELFKTELGENDFTSEKALKYAIETHIRDVLFDPSSPSADPILYCSIETENMLPFLETCIAAIKALPTDLDALIPFFDPRAIEISSETAGLWKSILDKFIPKEEAFSWTHVPTVTGRERYHYQFRASPSSAPEDIELAFFYGATWRPYVITFICGLVKEYVHNHPTVPLPPLLQEELRIQDTLSDITAAYVDIKMKEIQEAEKRVTEIKDELSASMWKYNIGDVKKNLQATMEKNGYIGMQRINMQKFNKI